MSELTGTSLGKYKVVARIDRGAMGEVYKGYHTNLNRDVAIKVLRPHLATAADFVERFEREASVVARLRHTSIVQVYDFDVQDDLYYMVMEYIDGPTLKAEMVERHRDERPFSLFEIGYIATALAQALDYAHVRGVIHRDIKPANVMFNAEGQIVLADFGIVHIVSDATIADERQIIGTPAYLSPEQGSGQAVTAASDIYSMGIVFYELVTGRLPFSGDSGYALILDHINTPPIRPSHVKSDLPAGLEKAILKSLHKEPAQRYQKASHFARDIRQAIGMSAEEALTSYSIESLSQTITPSVAPTIDTVNGESRVTRIAGSRPGFTGEVSSINPYRGLFAFREEDARFFFGREEFIEQLLELVEEDPLVAVVGPSGSGKSSVVFAGLLPALRQQGNWVIEEFRPRGDPFQGLAGALVDHYWRDISTGNRPQAIQRLAGELKSGKLRLHEVIERIVRAKGRDAHLLLVADQFEELFTLGDDDSLRQRFLDQIAEAVDIQTFHDEKRFTLVLTLRADFLGQALRHGPFASVLQDADVKLGPMARPHLVRAIANPARRLGVNFESGLVMRVAGDVGDEPGNLPLLEFALSALWEQREDNLLTHEGYEEIGGVTGALARHANSVYRHLTAEEQLLARRVLVQMVQPGDGTPDTRRVAGRSELHPEEWQLVQRLADERLVVTGANESGEETAELVHEALIRGWNRLREWMAADRSYRAWQERLRAAIDQWEASGRDEGALLRGAPLQQALEWTNSETIILSPAELGYIQASREAAERAEREKEEQRQRELEQAQALSESRQRQVRVVRMASVALGILLLLAVAAAALAFWQRGMAQNNAEEAALQATAAFVAQATAVANEEIAATRAVEAEAARATAEAERQEAQNQRSQAESARADAEAERAEAVRLGQVALGQSLVSLAQSVAEQDNDRELATLLALEAQRLNEEAEGNIGWYVDSALRPLVSEPFFNTTLTGHSGGVQDVDFSPDGRWLASGANDNTVRLWEWTELGSKPIVLDGPEAPVLAVSFATDGSQLAAGSEDGTIWVWDTAALEQPPLALPAHDDAVLALAFGSGGRLASAGLAGQVLLWGTLVEGATPQVLLDQEQHTLGLAFSDNGQSLALAGNDRTVKILDLASGQSETLGNHDSSVLAVTFSPDGTRLASTSVDSTVRIWDVEADGADPIILEGHTSRVRDVVFLADGMRLASASDDNTLRIWDLQDPEAAATVLPGHELRVRSLALSPDGLFLASGSDDKTVRLWRTSVPDGADQVLRAHNANIIAVTFSPEGERMFTSGADNNIRLWDTSTYQETGSLSGHSGRVRALALAPSTNLLASGADDSLILLWDLEEQQSAPQRLEGHEGSVRALLFADEDEILFSAGDDGIVRRWQITDLQAGPTIFDEPAVALHSLALSPDGEQLLAGTGDGRILVWQIDDPQAEPIMLEGHDQRVNDLAFSPDGNWLAAASEDWTISRWEWRDLGAPPTFFIGHQAGVRALAFSPDNERLVSTGQDQTVRIWNPFDAAEPPAVLNGHTAAVLDVAFAPNQPLFATVSDDGTIRLWKYRETLAEVACHLVRRNLSQEEWNAFLGGVPYRPTCPDIPGGS